MLRNLLWDRQRSVTDLEDDGLVVLDEVEGEDVGEHERLAALAQHVDRLLEELHLDPRHVVLLHLLHLDADRAVQLQRQRDSSLPWEKVGASTEEHVSFVNDGEG